MGRTFLSGLRQQTLSGIFWAIEQRLLGRAGRGRVDDSTLLFFPRQLPFLDGASEPIRQLSRQELELIRYFRELFRAFFILEALEQERKATVITSFRFRDIGGRRGGGRRLSSTARGASSVSAGSVGSKDTGVNISDIFCSSRIPFRGIRAYPRFCSSLSPSSGLAAAQTERNTRRRYLISA